MVLTALTLSLTDAQARKKGYRLDTRKSSGTSTTSGEESDMVKGSFMVASQCTDCNNGYTLRQITFTGFDKPQNSSTETFFITNNTDRTLTGVNLYIDYRMPDGRQLHKRFMRLTCDIPPGETRKTDIESWDRQRSFYFTGSTRGRNSGTPFTVTFDPVAYYLRF